MSYLGQKLRHPGLNRLFRHAVVRNWLSLAVLQFVSQLMPLITIPILARVLRPDGWGEVLFVQSFAAWLAIILEYGFSYSATRSIAKSTAFNEPVASTVSGVLGAKILLAGICFILALASVIAVPAIHQRPDYLWLAWAGAIAQGFLPVWYFQGKQRLTIVAALSVIMRVLVTVATILWVRSPEDGWKVLLVQTVANLVLSAICLVWMYREIPFALPSRFLIREALRMGWPTFIFSLSASLYSTANGFMLGLRSTPTQVAFYGGAEKTHRAFLTPFGPLGQALYPHMIEMVALDYKRARTSAIKMLLLISAVGLGMGLLAFAGATLWVRLLLGSNYAESVAVLQIMALQLPLTGASRILGMQWMMPLRMESTLNLIVVAGGIANIVLAFVLAPIYGAIGMAVAFVTTEAMITLLMAVAIQRSPYPLFAAGAKHTAEM